ncbi:cortical protein marker for cell polarity-domain-containing protein [Halteromyces radiatus]|uniref:cortical protein marker for cell polarity-domain-containing protein n=1 Tax=Halteromyces radiatus TaxID=101107 RepID=UPI0022211AF1|nr:cortical protein marker for cell polarity-domain-containing protein [Halteromyces radiatus]KAI8093794.1 cortical protein marker for cell polarity-domain-containing protein [Halteromyces radiatus]
MMILLLLLYFTSTLSVISCTTIPSSVTSMVDLTSLEQMGLAGWYGGISLVTDTQQLTQIQLNTGSALLYKNNTLFQLLASTSISGSIYTSCQQGNDLYIGGYFSTLNQQNVSNIAKLSYNKDGTGQITPLVKGLDGPVYSLYCDTDRIYVGGDFLAPFTSSPQYGDSLAYYGGSMAVWMIKNGTWSSLPWKGVNGPIYSIEKFKGSIYFAGQFDSTTDGQSNHAPASQPINLQKPATVTAEGSDPNYSDASVVICSALDDHPWLLQDNTPGHWEVSFVYAVSPSLFRLGNTFYEGRGTNQFGILATTQNHYLNLSYVDPSTGQRRFCTNNCSLSNDPTVQFQDFLVINPNMTTGVRIDISSWYGLGGGLSSVEIYQSEIFVHAGNVGGFPDCSASEKQQLPVATATTKGKWTNAQTGYTQYLTSTFPAQQLKTNTNSVTFTPNLPEQTGNYSISIYTPGCNNKCQQRTKVDLQIYVNSTSPITVTIDQNTSGDRVDKIYTGPISPTTANFKPRVVLSVSKSATTPTKGNVILVADKVQWIKEASIPGLSSVLVYNPSVQSTTNNTLLPWSTLPQTNNLPWKSQVNTMDIVNGDLYIGGNFSDTNAGNMSYHNIVKLNGQTNQLVPLSGTGGLNGIVSSLTHIGSDLYVGGAFDGFPAQATVATTSPPSKNVIKYNTQQQSWVNLDGGVNGPVSTVALTGNNQTHVLVSGSYTGLYDATGTIIANTTSGNAWWYSATSRWAPSIDQPYLSGIVYTTEMAAPSATDQQRQQLYLGNIKSAQRYAAHGFVYMNNQTIPLAPLPFQPNASMQTDVITAGAFWNDPQHGNASTIILGGSFTLSSPSNSTATIRNVAMYQNGQWQGIGADAWQGSIHTMMVVGNRLFIGGQFSTSTPSGANSFAIYDLVNQTFVHVPDLHTSDGSPTLVNVIKYNDADSVVIVGGNFSTGGSLSCYGVCALDMNEYQWNNLGDGVLGNVTDFVLIDNKLMVAGNLTLANGKAVPVAAYDYGGNYWDTISSDTTENGLPGPCHTVSYDNNTRTTFFAGQTNTSTAYIRMWNGQQFSSPNEELGPGSTIEQLSVLPTVTNTTSNLAGNSKAVLLATGFLNLGQGNVSAALYNGTNWIPYLAASAVDGTSGLFSRVFFKSYSMSVHNTRHLPTPLVILISVASALGVVFVLILSSLMVMFVKRRQEAKVDCAQPWNYYGKPPQTPEALLEMLASGNAVTGLYSLTDSSNNEKGIIGQKAEFGTVVSAATLGATTLGAASMTSNGTTNEKDISPPPAAYLANPTGAFDGPREMQSTTTTREMVTPTTQRSSYNPFRASATLGMAVSEPDIEPPVLKSSSVSPASSRRSSVSSLASYHDTTYGDTSFADTPTAPTDTSSQSDPHAFLTKPFDLSSSSSSQQQKSSSPSSQQQQSSLPSSQQQPQQQQKQKQSLSSQQQQQSSSSSSQQQGHPALDGRAASKKMIQDYFSSRGELPSGTTTKEESKPYKDDFKRAMQAALENNQANKDQANCSADHPYLYVAKFDFSAREHGELGFEKGDPIIVIDAEDDIWWMGYKDGEKPQQGVFPSNYVERATSLPY